MIADLKAREKKVGKGSGGMGRNGEEWGGMGRGGRRKRKIAEEKRGRARDGKRGGARRKVEAGIDGEREEGKG